jgi:hypothetical protein
MGGGWSVKQREKWRGNRGTSVETGSEGCSEGADFFTAKFAKFAKGRGGRSVMRDGEMGVGNLNRR